MFRGVPNFYRAYQHLVEQRNLDRQSWRSRHPRREGTRARNFPPELSNLPPFRDWFRARIINEKAEGLHVDQTVEAVSCFPSTIATRYRSMFGYGYHYRVRSAEIPLKSMDSGIAATFLRECRFGMRDMNPIVAPIEYIGNLEEIIELDYSVFRQVVLIGTWVRANYRGSNATVKKDQWGFTIANFTRTIPFGRESFAFPQQVEQVFFCDCVEAPGWKVVVRTEPRGKRVDANTADVGGGLLFRHGRDSEFSALRVPEVVSEDPLPASENGRVIRMTEALEDDPQEEHATFDADLGASSSEED